MYPHSKELPNENDKKWRDLAVIVCIVCRKARTTMNKGHERFP